MFEFLRQIFDKLEDYLPFWKIIDIYERGVRLRFGKNPVVLEPGFHFKWPLADMVFTCIVTIDTMSTHAVHVTTMDQKTITVTPVIEYQIVDPIAWLMETNEASSNLHDLTRGVVADHLTDITWAECTKKTTATDIKAKLNRRVESIGAKIHKLILADVCINRVIITQI